MRGRMWAVTSIQRVQAKAATLRKFHGARFDHFRHSRAPEHETFDDASVHRPRSTATPRHTNLGIFKVNPQSRNPTPGKGASEVVRDRLMAPNVRLSEVCKEMYRQVGC